MALVPDNLARINLPRVVTTSASLTVNDHQMTAAVSTAIRSFGLIGD